MLRADTHSYQYVLARVTSQCWEKCFSISLAISNMLRKHFPADGPFLHGSDGRIEIDGNWNRQSSCFRSRNGILVCSLFIDYYLDFPLHKRVGYALDLVA